MTTVQPSITASKATPNRRDQRDDTDLTALIAALPAAVDQAMRKTLPDEYSPELAAQIAAGAAILLQERRAPSSPVRAELAGLATTQCCARRPDRDALTGRRLDGQEDTDETFRDRLLCVEPHTHDSDHRDALGRSWARDKVPA